MPKVYKVYPKLSKLILKGILCDYEPFPQVSLGNKEKSYTLSSWSGLLILANLSFASKYPPLKFLFVLLLWFWLIVCWGLNKPTQLLEMLLSIASLARLPNDFNC